MEELKAVLEKGDKGRVAPDIAQEIGAQVVGFSLTKESLRGNSNRQLARAMGSSYANSPIWPASGRGRVFNTIHRVRR